MSRGILLALKWYLHFVNKPAKLLPMAKKMAPEPGVSEYLRKIGKKGGKARLKTMTPEERSAIARQGGQAGGRGRKKKAKTG